ncbi:MAG: guanine deaminase [Candidatus Obscuribacter sp.]|nr:guanine deaminase [Candidatus Obscuribacter sp.]
MKLQKVAYRGHIISPTVQIDEGGREICHYIDYQDGLLVVDNTGKVIAVGPFAELASTDLEIVDYGRRLILPGLVDLHLHLPQVTQTAKSGEHLLAWLNRFIFPAEAKFASVEYARKIAHWFFDELAKNGTTMAVVFTTIHKAACQVAFEEALAKGSRVIMGKVMMDTNSPDALTEDTTTSIKESEELARVWHGQNDGLLQYAFTPRFGVTSTKELLAGVGKSWQKFPGTYIHTHLSEAREEIQFVHQQFPDARSYLDVYKNFGMTGARSVFAHAIHLDDADIVSVKQTGSALAHCASSNFFLKSGVFQYKKVWEAGCRFGLGSDVAAGPQMSLFTVMKDANYIQPDHWLEPRELLYRGTLGGARAIYMDDQIGSLEAGKEADFIVVDPRKKTGIVDDILEHGTDEILASLVFLGDDRLIDKTFVRGRLIYDCDQSA